MKRGNEVNFSNINSPFELKQLNDIINYILSVLSSRFDLSNKYNLRFFLKKVMCTGNDWTSVKFDFTFSKDPVYFLYSDDGFTVLTRKNPLSADYKSELQIMSADTSKSGYVNVIVIGETLL